MTCEISVADFTTVARLINLAHRFQCVPTSVESKTEGALTTANPNNLQTCSVASGTPTVVNANAVVNDGAAADSTDTNYYLATFPYLAAPLPGAPNAARAAIATLPTSTGTAAGN